MNKKSYRYPHGISKKCNFEKAQKKKKFQTNYCGSKLQTNE